MERLSSVQFEELRETGGLLVIKFEADWCEACKEFQPVFEEVSEEYSWAGTFGVMDLEADKNLAASLGIRFLPSVIIMENGSVKEVIAGNRSSMFLMNRIENHL